MRWQRMPERHWLHFMWKANLRIYFAFIGGSRCRSWRRLALPTANPGDCPVGSGGVVAADEDDGDRAPGLKGVARLGAGDGSTAAAAGDGYEAQLLGEVEGRAGAKAAEAHGDRERAHADGP